MLAITKTELMLIQDALDGNLEATVDATYIVECILSKGIPVIATADSIMAGIMQSNVNE